MKTTDRLILLEKEVQKLKYFIWYVAGTLTLKFGSEALPMVSALILR